MDVINPINVFIMRDGWMSSILSMFLLRGMGGCHQSYQCFYYEGWVDVINPIKFFYYEGWVDVINPIFFYYEGWVDVINPINFLLLEFLY